MFTMYALHAFLYYLIGNFFNNPGQRYNIYFNLLVSAKTFYCQRSSFQSLIICDSELSFSKAAPHYSLFCKFHRLSAKKEGYEAQRGAYFLRYVSKKPIYRHCGHIFY